MELKVIENLIEKYLNAETSLKEEDQLKSYFCSGSVAPHLQEYVPLFSYFTEAKEDIYSGKPAFRSGRKKVYAWVAVAASVILMAGIFAQQNRYINKFGSYEDPELAMQKTIETLQMVSEYMNTGAEELKYLEEFERTKNKLIQQ